MLKPEAVRAETLTELFHKLCRRMLKAEAKEIDYDSSIDCHVYDVVGVAESFEWSYDLKHMWLTKGRWNTLVRQYLDPQDVIAWLEQCRELRPGRDRGVSTVRTNTVRARQHASRKSRRFGSCMLALSYRAIPHPTVTLHSRASYLGYLGPLDLTLAYTAGKYIAAIHDVPVEDMRFTWYVEALQWPNYKSLGYILNHGGPRLVHAVVLKESLLQPAEKEMIRRYPVVARSRYWMRRYIDQDNRRLTYSEAEKMAMVRRIRQRWHAEFKQYGDRFSDSESKALAALPSVELNEMDFSTIGLPGVGSSLL